jgi:hypothetical protein
MSSYELLILKCFDHTVFYLEAIQSCPRLFVHLNGCQCLSDLITTRFDPGIATDPMTSYWIRGLPRQTKSPPFSCHGVPPVARPRVKMTVCPVFSSLSKLLLSAASPERSSEATEDFAPFILRMPKNLDLVCGRRARVLDFKARLHDNVMVWFEGEPEPRSVPVCFVLDSLVQQAFLQDANWENLLMNDAALDLEIGNFRQKTFSVVHPDDVMAALSNSSYPEDAMDVSVHPCIYNAKLPGVEVCLFTVPFLNQQDAPVGLSWLRFLGEFCLRKCPSTGDENSQVHATKVTALVCQCVTKTASDAAIPMQRRKALSAQVSPLRSVKTVPITVFVPASTLLQAYAQHMADTPVTVHKRPSLTDSQFNVGDSEATCRSAKQRLDFS